MEGYEPGQQLKVEETFKEGDKVDVAGTSIGKGFQGTAMCYKGFNKPILSSEWRLV